ncbi:uncharacterized protein LOC130589923 [Beta vulgaris subsp. vulgaris]|uniref:uncharacterized protein LOC130589923 n=1 Tax=Beta vulgaris subsp. vulgaris TaxID=3555 RepID=UPI002547F7C2|nr:uncharacterized protein LOC130589923 [Beta vulgaris subsp. vulgaris]
MGQVDVMEEDNFVMHDSIDELMHDRFRETIVGAGNSQGPNEEARKFHRLVEEGNQELFPGCKTFSKLSFIIRLLLYKTLHGLSNVAFDDLLKLWKENMKMQKNVMFAIHQNGNNRKRIKEMTAKSMAWHADEREEDGNLRHPADGLTWKNFDSLYPNFSKDSRNVRLGVPYVVLVDPGPESPGNNIDVYMQPLKEELLDLWNNGVQTYDKYNDQTFQLHAALMWTISDFPGYSMLSGWKTKGKFACPECNFETPHLYLKNSRKMCYMDFRRLLDANHPFRSSKKAFNGKEEQRPPPKPLTGIEVHSELLNFENLFGKTGKTKDHAKGRFDLMDLGFKEELHPQLADDGKHVFFKKGSFSMSPQEKDIFCRALKEAKLPYGVHLILLVVCVPPKGKLLVILRNRSHPEGSMAEGYWLDECSNFIARYMQGVKSTHSNEDKEGNSDVIIFRRVGHPLGGKKRRKGNLFTLDANSLQQAHRYALFNSDSEEVNEYISEHELYVSCQSRKTKGPSATTKRYSGYYVNGFRFYTKERDNRCKTQNSGVSLVALTPSFASTKDKNPVLGKVAYFGSILEIIELNYWSKFSAVLFRCEWYQEEKDNYGLPCVNVNKFCSLDDPFVLPSQVHQVWYALDPISSRLNHVMNAIPRDIYDFGEGEEVGHSNREDIEPMVMDANVTLDGVATDEQNREDSDFDDTMWDRMEADEDFDNVAE